MGLWCIVSDARTVGLGFRLYSGASWRNPEFVDITVFAVIELVGTIKLHPFLFLSLLRPSLGSRLEGGYQRGVVVVVNLRLDVLFMVVSQAVCHWLVRVWEVWRVVMALREYQWSVHLASFLADMINIMAVGVLHRVVWMILIIWCLVPVLRLTSMLVSWG